jgi:hypothetical protein
VNGTSTSSNSYQLCMDTAALNWKQTLPDGSYTMVNTAANEGLGWYYSVTADGKCQKMVPQSAAASSQLPFSFMTIDYDAHKDGSGLSPDSNIQSEVWAHYRRGQKVPVITPSEDMHWFVSYDDNGDARMIESTCQETYGTSPGDGGDSTVQSGNRDFSSNFDAAAGEDASTYADPPGDCTEVTPSSGLNFGEGALFKTLF